MNKYLLAALLAATFALACGQGSTDGSSTTPVEVVNTDPELEYATLAIEITGKPADALQPRRLGPPTESPLITLTNEENGQVVNVAWTGTLAYAKVKMGTYVCEVVADGFAPDTSSITVNESDLGSTVNVTISLRANGPTKPEPVELGEYKVERAHTDDKYEVVGMWDLQKYTARVTYTAAFGSNPAQYQLHGDLPEFTCTANGAELTCEQWTSITGGVFNAIGMVADGNATIELKVVLVDYPGQPDEYTEYLRYRLTKSD